MYLPLFPKSNIPSKTDVNESELRLQIVPLTVSQELRKFVLLLMIAPSSNGKTADSGQSSVLRVLRALLLLLPSVDKIVC
jgi:hypothetical protein